VHGESLFLVQYSFAEPMQRIFNRDKTPDTTLTPDNVLSILIYESPFVSLHTRVTIFKNGPVFLAHSPLSIYLAHYTRTPQMRCVSTYVITEMSSLPM